MDVIIDKDYIVKTLTFIVNLEMYLTIVIGEQNSAFVSPKFSILVLEH